MARYIFDIETNGLLDQLDRVHSLVLLEVDSGEVHSFTPENIREGVDLLMQADMIIGHNVIGFDIPALQIVYPDFVVDEARVFDTLTISRLIWTDLSDLDSKRMARGHEHPSKLVGSHSLAAWGYRVGVGKLDYQGGWEQWSAEMQYYCERDVEVTERLWKLIESKQYSQDAIDLEHRVQWIIARQEARGFAFDVKQAEKLQARLEERRATLEVELQDTFRPWYSGGEVVTPKRTVNYKNRAGTFQGAPYTKLVHNVFNPGSRHHIANRLQTINGWKPAEFTNDGHPKVDETTLSSLNFPEAKLITEYLTLQKRLGQLSEGRYAWIKLQKNGRIHGRVITNGAVTGRATHQNPNVAQCPAVGAPWGADCRALFTTSAGKVLVGIDLSGLELRMLGHFMAKYDNGLYAKEVVDGDVHTANQRSAGLPTRNDAKRFIYAYLYGCGIPKMASILNTSVRKAAVVRKSFLAKTPALARLIRDVQGAAENRGYLLGLDKRHLKIRSSHAALNTLLQGGGALVCKQFLVEFDIALRERGWSERAQQVAWVHDEIQVECDPDIADEVGHLAVASIKKSGEHFGLRVPLDGEYKVGANWKETH